MIKSHENDLAAGFAQQLNNAISERERQRARKQAEYAKQRLLVKNFLVRASAAVTLAVEAISMRARELRFDSPVVVETTFDFKDGAHLALGNDSMSATLTMSMTRAAATENEKSPIEEHRPPTAGTSTRRCASGITATPNAPALSIEAYREPLEDAWRWDCIPGSGCAGARFSSPAAAP